MSPRVSAYYEDRGLTRWRDFDRNMPGVPTYVFGFRAELPEINRWAARYRAAASFESANLAQYQSQETVAGYSALIRATLVWSAFERYLPIIGLDQERCGALLESFNATATAERVAGLDADGRLFTYIRSRVTNRRLADQLDAYAKGDPFNVSYLLSAIRHIFGHGHLTPSSNEAESTITIEICNVLSEFHLRVMDEDFSRHVKDFEKMMAKQHR